LNASMLDQHADNDVNAALNLGGRVFECSIAHELHRSVEMYTMAGMPMDLYSI